jgi:hypothetical protein
VRIVSDVTAGLAARLRETALLGGLEVAALEELSDSVEVIGVLGGETVIREGERRLSLHRALGPAAGVAPTRRWQG